MPDNYPFDHFMSVYSGAYKTVDLRMALMFDNAKWNLFGVHIFVRIASADAVTASYSQKTHQRTLDTGKLKIVQRNIPFTGYQDIKSWLTKGRIELDDLSVTFDPVKADSLHGRIDSIGRSDLDWPTFRASAALSTNNTIYQLIQQDRELVRDIERAGFVNLDDVMKTLLELESTQSLIVLLVDADIPVKSDLVTADKPDPKSTSFTISVIAQHELSGFSANVISHRRSERQYLGQISLQQAEKVGENRRWRGSLKAKNVLEKNDRIEFDLIHDNIGHIGRSSFFLGELYKEEVRNPLLHALSYFCPLDKFRSMVHSAKGKPVVDLKSDKKYEVIIQWLLSVAGFQTIWLNKHEELRIDDHLYGTVDCLAYSEKDNMLLFVNCTLAKPSGKELNSYREVHDYFADNAFKDSSLRLYSIVFSNSKSAITIQTVRVATEPIVYYRDQIDQLFESVVNGREHELVSSILNPLFPSIR